MCNKIENGCEGASLVSTEPVPAQTVYIDAQLSLTQSQQLFVFSVNITLPDQSIFTKNFAVNSYGLTACYAYQNTGMLFDAFNNQQEVFCTPGTGDLK